MKKQKRRVFFSIGGNAAGDFCTMVSAGKFTKKTRGLKAKIAN